ncbi:hypothetical protein QOZ80_6BG0480940 [Eleusine coracana subsp. coracana]|nr:hypothetical protein QOZ80_6BG0480940 [Eleusine coracana subsp. coracana]
MMYCQGKRWIKLNSTPEDALLLSPPSLSPLGKLAGGLQRAGGCHDACSGAGDGCWQAEAATVTLGARSSSREQARGIARKKKEGRQGDGLGMRGAPRSGADAEWRNGNFSGGCRRKEPVQCVDGFAEIQNMKLPNWWYTLVPNRNLQECTAGCMRDCSCVAYAFANQSTSEKKDSTRCFVWAGELIDMERVVGSWGDFVLRRSQQASFLGCHQLPCLMDRPCCPYIAIVLCVISWWPILCTADSQIVLGKPLFPGTTLVSDGGAFALGFFSPPGSNSSSSLLYLGIWYNNIPKLTVVWVASQAAPILAGNSSTSSKKSASLVLTNTSNLVLSDATGRVLWTPNVTSSSLSSVSRPVAVLLNTGNLVIRSPEGTTLWQSFDHPSNTFLPGMKLGINFRTHSGARYVSWRSATDPLPGSFSFGQDPDRPLQLIIWKGSRLYWRSTPWSGYMVESNYNSDNKGGGRSAIYMEVIYNDEEEYSTISLSEGAPPVHSLMNYSGEIEMQGWSNETSEWVTFSRFPARACSYYGYCGAFGYCGNSTDDDGVSSTCHCIEGFEPESGTEWSRGNFSQGCRRKEPVRCDDGFVALPGLKMPDAYTLVPNRSLEECATGCIRDCSCVAYAYANLSTSTKILDSTRCLVWTGDLIDMERVAGILGDFGETLYLRLAGAGRGSSQVAIKRLSIGSNQGMAEFKNEVLLIAKLQYRNLVRLVGCCMEGDEKLLIYEYLPNGSLDTTIFNSARKSMLDWSMRFKIIKGVARGLLYLHQDSRLTIIHRDLKASNILLDAAMNPKISDFGMARIFDDNQELANTMRVVGTYGYMAPEYAMEGIFSVKSDVYSFGVLLLEIVSGVRINDTALIGRSPNLIVYAWNLWNEQKAETMIDSAIVTGCILDEFLLCVHLALLCVQENLNDRPAMSQVVPILENGSKSLAAPNRPAHFARRNNEMEHVIGNSKCSHNSLTITVVEGR